MNRSPRIPILLLAVVLAIGGIAGARPALSAAPASEAAARESVGKPVQAAQQLIKEKKLKEALAKLQQADNVADKTSYERYIIAETRTVAAIDLGDDAMAVKSLEAVLATGILAPAEALKRMVALVQLSYRAKDYAKVADYATRYYKEGGSDGAPRLLLARVDYEQSDFAGAARLLREALQHDTAAGKPASEEVLLLLASSEYKRQNQSGYIDALESLLTLYPKPEYWTDVLTALQRKPGFARRLLLDVDRLMIETGAMTTQDQYMEAAQLALVQGLPGEAKAMLDKGYARGVLGKGAGAERQQHLLAMATQQATEESSNLAKLAREADAAPSGLPSLKLAETYASDGQYQAAVTAYQKALQKGGLKYPEDAKLHLGLALLRAGDRDHGKAQLSAVTGDEGPRDLARLWLIADRISPR